MRHTDAASFGKHASHACARVARDGAHATETRCVQGLLFRPNEVATRVSRHRSLGCWRGLSRGWRSVETVDRRRTWARELTLRMR